MNKLIKKVCRMDLGNPIMTALVGLVVFYIGLKMFSGGMKSMGNLEHLNFLFRQSNLYVPWWYCNDTALAKFKFKYNGNNCTGSLWGIASARSHSGSVRRKHRNHRHHLVSRFFCERWYAQRRYT